MGPDGAREEAAGEEVGDVAMVWEHAGALSPLLSVTRRREDATAQPPLEEHRHGIAVQGDAERTVAVGGEHGRLVGVVAAEKCRAQAPVVADALHQLSAAGHSGVEPGERRMSRNV